MDIIKFSSTYKASGKDYERIVFWNRFIRNKTELIISLTPGIVSIALMFYGFRSTFAMVAYCVCIIYPLIAYRQFKLAVSYHLKHRDALESAECDFTLMESGILCEFHDSDEKKIFKWEDCTTIYDRVGYYMLFNKGEMLVMLCKADIPTELSNKVVEYMREHIDHNKCIIK